MNHGRRPSMNESLDSLSECVQAAVSGARILKPYEPGKPLEALEREYGIRDAVKLASNENPLGASAAARTAAQDALADLARYPDGNGFALKDALARHHGVSPQCITLGNGSNDVLDLVARVFLGPGRNAVFSRHAFAVYPIATLASGARCNMAAAYDAHADMPYGHDLNAMGEAVNADTGVVFIANPNNPTGTWLPSAALEGFIRDLPPRVAVVVDEAYFEYVEQPDYPDASAWLERFPNLIVTRTFSKVHGLAALRVGYGLSHPALADLFNRVRQPFNVNAVAQAAAVAALADGEHVARSVQVNREGLAQWRQGLEALQLSWIPSVANFLSVEVGEHAESVYEALLRAGVIARPIAAYELPGHLRFTIGTASENARALAALAAALQGARA